MAIDCCNGCEAPKRHPGCHATCEIYITAKAEYDARKAKYDREHDIDCAISRGRTEKVLKAMKRHRYK